MSIKLAAGCAIEVIGTALVEQVFPFGDQTVAGCRVTQGALRSGQPVLVHRGAEVVYQGLIRSLKQSSSRVERVSAGQECGVLVEPSGALGHFDGFAVGDIVESYTLRYVGTRTPAAQPPPETRPVELALLRLRSLLGGVDEEAALGKLYAAARHLEGYVYHDVHRNKRISFLRGGRVWRDIQTRISLRKGTQPVLEHDEDSQNNRVFRVTGADTELLELIERVERGLHGM
jgi:hypothetical protein